VADMFVHLRKQFSKTIWAWGRLHGEEEKGTKKKEFAANAVGVLSIPPSTQVEAMRS